MYTTLVSFSIGVQGFLHSLRTQNFPSPLMGEGAGGGSEKRYNGYHWSRRGKARHCMVCRKGGTTCQR